MGGSLVLAQINSGNPRHRLVSGVTKLSRLIVVLCLVYVTIGGSNCYLSLSESRLATAYGAEPVPAEAAPTLKSVDPNTAPASATPPNVAPDVTNQAAPSVGVAGSPTAELLTRGDMLLDAGDVVGAQLLYERGAGAGDSVAALRLGETFDPSVLQAIHLGFPGDRARAAYWYRKARDLGSAEANVMLKSIERSDTPPTVAPTQPLPANEATPSVAATLNNPGADIALAGQVATPTPPANSATPANSVTTVKPSGHASPSAPKGAPATVNTATPVPGEAAARPSELQGPPKSVDPNTAFASTTPPNVAPAVTNTAAPSAAVGTASRPVLSAGELSALLARGDVLFGTGDVVSAQLFYERGAGAGDSVAALRLGETFDPTFLARIRLGFVAGDSVQAGHWYRRARDLGNADAKVLLKSVSSIEK